MADVIWLEGEAGAVLTMAAPLPPAVQKRVDDGLMHLIPAPAPRAAPLPPAERQEAPQGAAGEPESAQEPAPPDAVPMPSNGASRAEWERYALSQGMEPDRVATMTRNQLAAAMRLRSAS